jgi:hypothetical protein
MAPNADNAEIASLRCHNPARTDNAAVSRSLFVQKRCTESYSEILRISSKAAPDVNRPSAAPKEESR